jgi:hypothetical protein
MDRVRRRVGDKRDLALVKAFLKAGILGEDGFLRNTSTGTPQGGIMSPLLANVALSVLDEHFAEGLAGNGCDVLLTLEAATGRACVRSPLWLASNGDRDATRGRPIRSKSNCRHGVVIGLASGRLPLLSATDPALPAVPERW